MRNLKRALSLAVASVMLLGMMVVGTSASYPDVSSKNNVEAIEVLQAVGVMVGDENGNFNPDQKVTRNEMAVIMANLLDLKVDDFSAASIKFTDVPAWAAKYVAACKADGIIAGYSETVFGGSDTVTAAQAALMLQKALGYFQFQSDFGDDWQLATVKQASKIDLFDGVNAGAGTALTRNEVAQLALNALEATMVEADGNGGTTIKGDGFEITTGSTKYVDVLKTGSKYNAIDDTKDGTKSIVQLGEELFGGDLKKAAGEHDDFGRPAVEWTYKTDSIGTYGEEADYVVVLDDDYSDETDILDVIHDLTGNDDLVLYTVGAYDDVKLYVNGELTSDYAADAKYGTIVEIYCENDDEDEITTVVAYNYTLDQITEVDTDVTTADAKDGVSAYVTFELAGEFDDDEIVGFNAKTYVEDAYVAIIEKDGEIIASYIPEVVTGSVATKKTGEFVTVDGTKYYAAATFGTSLDGFVAIADVSTKSSDEYKLYVDENGYLLGITGVETAAVIEDVYYVDVVWAKNSTVSGASVPSYYAQLVNVDTGVVSEIELEKKDHDLTSNKNDLSNSTDYANYDALAGLFVTISDNKETDSKKDNSKYNLTEWDYADDWDKYAVSAFAKDFTKDAARIDATVNGSTKTFRLNSETKYLFLEDTMNDLAVSTAIGGVAYDKDKVTSAIVITEDGKTAAKYVIIKTADADQTTEYSEDVVFIKSVSTESGDGYISQTVYLPDGSNKAWKIDDGETYEAGKFYTYGTNADGFYELDEADAMTVASSFVWDDEEGVLLGVTIDEDALYGTLLTVEVGDKTVSDIETSGAKFVDLHDTDADGAYDRTVGTLSRLCDLVDDGKVTGIEMYLNVSEDGAVVIFVTEINVPA